MNKSLFNQFFRSGGGFVINRVMVRLYGAELSIFLADLADREDYFNKKFPQHEGWFFAIKERRSIELGMSDRTLSRLMKLAKDKNLVETKQKGIPAKEWILIKYDEIQSQLEYFLMEESSFNSQMEGEASPTGTAEASLAQTAEARGTDNAEALYITKPIETKPNKQESQKILYLDLFPTEFQESKRFHHVWSEWLSHRKEIGHSIKPTTAKKQAAQLTTWGIRAAIKSIERSITNGWQGLFEDDKRTPSKPTRPTDPRPSPGKYANLPTVVISNDEEEN